MTLPVYDIFPQLNETLKRHSKVVLQAPPGAGKSTLLPLLLLETGEYSPTRQIIMLEPRRVAARQIAAYLAKQLGEKVGESVGIRMRGEAKTSRKTMLTIVTDGTMVKQIQNDPELTDIALILFDEFHERAMQADLALALALETQELNEQLKLLIMSATLDLEKLSHALEAPVVSSEGRQFPVDIEYVSSGLIPTVDEVLSVVKKALGEQSSSVLVFLPGISEIKRLQEQLEPYLDSSTDCFPLYGALSLAEQSNAIAPAVSGRRKVVLATNLAQTSLTIEGVDVVVDSGAERLVEHQFEASVDNLVTQPISQAAAIQRAGRAGRLGPGKCFRLGSKESFERRRQHDVAEIERADLSPLLLELAVWGSQFDELFWLSRPVDSALIRANQKLVQLGFLSQSDNKYRATELAQWYGEQQLDLRTAKLLFELTQKRDSVEQTWWPSAIELASLLETNARLSGDLETAIARLSRVDKNQFEQNKRKLTERFAIPKQAAADVSDWGILLALTYPDRIAMKQGKRWKLANGIQASFAFGQQEPNAKFIAIASLNSSAKGVFIQAFVPIQSEHFKQALSHLVEEKEAVFWSDSLQKPSKAKERRIGQLILESSPLSLQLSEAQWQSLWMDYIRNKGLEVIGWGSESQIAFCRRIDLVKSAFPEDDWPSSQYEELVASMANWLAPYLSEVRSLKQLQQLQLSNLLSQSMQWNQTQLLDSHCPTHYVTPAGNKTKIDYSSETIKISVKLQEMFGVPQSPTICDAKVPLTIELLSPAKRPLQITKDLGHFWANAYTEVKKEMKGRYPKHPWPDDPLTALATNKTKRHLSK